MGEEGGQEAVLILEARVVAAMAEAAAAAALEKASAVESSSALALPSAALTAADLIACYDCWLAALRASNSVERRLTISLMRLASSAEHAPALLMREPLVRAVLRLGDEILSESELLDESELLPDSQSCRFASSSFLASRRWRSASSSCCCSLSAASRALLRLVSILRMAEPPAVRC